MLDLVPPGLFILASDSSCLLVYQFFWYLPAHFYLICSFLAKGIYCLLGLLFFKHFLALVSPGLFIPNSSCFVGMFFFFNFIFHSIYLLSPNGSVHIRQWHLWSAWSVHYCGLYLLLYNRSVLFISRGMKKQAMMIMKQRPEKKKEIPDESKYDLGMLVEKREYCCYICLVFIAVLLLISQLLEQTQRRLQHEQRKINVLAISYIV